MQRFDIVREKDFNLHFCTRNRNYFESIESDCINKGESLSFAHSNLDLIGPFVQVDSVLNFGPIEVEIHMEHSDIHRRLQCELDISCTLTTAESRAKIRYQ